MLELDKLYGAIKDGTVTGKEIEDYNKQANQLQALYEAAKVGNALLVCHFAEVNVALKVCVEKLVKVKKYRSKLLVVVDYCRRISKGT